MTDRTERPRISPRISQLREQYLELINRQLPTAAKAGNMPVRFNHCFARIVLDNLCKGCWYDTFSRKQPAYKQLSESQLEAAIAIAQSILHDPSRAIALNENSLRWRGKLTERHSQNMPRRV